MTIQNAVITLPGNGNYAVTLPGQITFVLEATHKELEEARQELLREFIPEELILSEPRASLAVIPTFDCNLKCVYCYAKGGDSKEVIQMGYVKKALEYKREKNPNAQWLDLYLVGGGEPLLYFDKVQEIQSLARNLFKQIQIHVVTNGTFGSDVRSWLVQNEADVRISYDGVAQVFQRPYSNGESSVFDVEETIKFLAKSKIGPILQMIITSDSEHLMLESVLKAVNMGIEVVKIEPALASEVSRGTKGLEPNPISYARNLLKLIEYVAYHKLPLKIDTGFFTKPAVGYYCGMADGNFTLTPEGLITSCVEVARKTDPYMNLIGIGRVNQQELTMNKQNIKRLQDINYRKQLGGCSQCELRMICLGGCPMANIWRNGLPLRKSSFTCAVEHELLPQLLLMMAKEPIIMDVVMENTILA